MATVLIVDDQEDIAGMMKMLLELEGYTALLANDGDVAWNILQSGAHCDVVVTDLNMGRMSGLELANAMAQDSKLAHIPLLLLSGMFVSAAPPNVVELLAKPLDVQELLDKLARTVAAG